MTQIHPPSRRTSGVTLIELLAAVLIISTLAALLFPVFKSMTKKHRSVTCVNNLRTLTQGIAAYAADNDMTYPSHRLVPQSINAWYAPLMGLAPPSGYSVYVQHRGANKKRPPYFCPENPAIPFGNGAQFTNYAMNYYLIGAKTSIVVGTKVLLFDAYQPGLTPETWFVNQGGVGSLGQTKTWTGINPVHDDYINVSFTDGHVSAVRIRPGSNSSKDLNELKGVWFWPYSAN